MDENVRGQPVWSPQAGPQEALINCPCAEVFFGGARAGGKTDGVLGKWALKDKLYGPSFNAMMFRKTVVSSDDAIERSREIYGPLGGKFADNRWRMPNGGRVGFGYLDNVKDADQWQGRNLSDAWVDEVGLYAAPDAIWRLFGVLRSATGAPIQLILTGNPGGPGQHWIRGRYGLHPFPRQPKALRRKLPDGTEHLVAVIPSRITDNRILMERDPGYISRLHLVGSKQLVKAWLDGDWTAIEGAFFDCWSDKNILAPFKIPEGWVRFRSGDWGSFSPFSFGWWAVVQDDHARPKLPRGALVRYREWYGSTDPASGGKGLKLTAEQVADGLVERETGDPRLAYGVLDPSTFKVDGGPSIAERINRKLVAKKMASFRPADNTRVNTRDSKDKRGPMNGWDQMRSRIIGQIDDKGEPIGVPMLYVFSTCVAFIRTVPVLQHDPARPEDIDTLSEDHAGDDGRYACSSRPWTRTIKEPDAPVDGYRTATEDMDHVQSSVKLL
jgi:hypothetical protein